MLEAWYMLACLQLRAAVSFNYLDSYFNNKKFPFLNFKVGIKLVWKFTEITFVKLGSSKDQPAALNYKEFILPGQAKEERDKVVIAVLIRLCSPILVFCNDYQSTKEADF